MSILIGLALLYLLVCLLMDRDCEDAPCDFDKPKLRIEVIEELENYLLTGKRAG